MTNDGSKFSPCKHCPHHVMIHLWESKPAKAVGCAGDGGLCDCPGYEKKTSE